MKLKFCFSFLVCVAACGSETAPAEQAASPSAAMPDSTAAGASAAGRAGMSAPTSTGTAGSAGNTQAPPTTPPVAGNAADDMDASVPDPTNGQAGSGGAPSTQGPAEVISLMVDADREHMYDDATNWLCLPGSKEDLCTKDLDATIVRADGTTELEPHVVAADPQFDCFYVYPTVSNDTGSNSDLTANQEELDVVSAQAARYSRHCRVFAPLYRQVTLGALNGGGITDEARNTGYRDVVAAFNRYLTEHNQGRGFVLTGHSQGAGVLRRLIAEEIDGREPLRKRLISAHLLGTSVAVPAGMDVGGALKNVPICRANDQFGCVVTYATFRATTTPPSNSRFGKVMEGRAACANPGALGGGKGVLTPYFFTDSQAAFARGRGETISTKFITMPEFLEAECVDSGDFTYLALSVLSDAADPRADDVSGDITPDWGLHLIDVHIAMGNLVELTASAYAAFAAQP
jgi:hypothetical protein